MSEYKTIEELRGQTITLFEWNYDEAVITTAEGKRYRMYHSQDCCESVYVDEIEGDLDNLLNSPVLEAREEIGHDDPSAIESITLTDFHLTTAKGSVVIKWKGESNGYYSESVYFAEIQ